jgi:hypothetical protein
VGPPAATRVRLDVPGAAPVTVPLATGAGLVRRADVRSVEFLDDEDQVLDQVDVTGPLQGNARLPGAH